MIELVDEQQTDAAAEAGQPACTTRPGPGHIDLDRPHVG
jgi:hypothetical protein